MSVHQVITGALNKGDNVYSLGCVEGVKFIACSVGCDIVILSSFFERIQVISGSFYSSQQLITCINCCAISGKIVAVYGKTIRIFEPVYQLIDRSKQKYANRWFETQNLVQEKNVTHVVWSFEGLRLLICASNQLFLYQQRKLTIASGAQGVVKFGIVDEDINNDEELQKWERVWSQTLSAPLKYLTYSSDGNFFASCGADDSIVKVWYQLGSNAVGEVDFNFICLQHPVPVKGLEWRKLPSCLSETNIQNSLLTWCEDHTVRIWKETQNLDSSFWHLKSIDDNIVDDADARNVKKKRSAPQMRKKFFLHLKKLMKDKKRKNDFVKEEQQVNVDNSCILDFAFHSGDKSDVNFHLCGTINAYNDCLLVPSMEEVMMCHKPFTVHWLNNKEIMFDLEIDKLLAEVLVDEQNPRERSDNCFVNGGIVNDTNNEKGELDQNRRSSLDESREETISRSVFSIDSEESADTVKDFLSLKLEQLNRNWTKSNDILFAIHPIDGSLLTWTVEWLDDMFRQSIISFSSRFPSAFPITDAKSLNPCVNTFSPYDPLHVSVMQRNSSISEILHVLERRSTNVLYLLTNHENGSLNLWHMSMDDKSNYTCILNISHASRMCGHRFQISQITAHPLLPLMLTTSSFNDSEYSTNDLGRSELIFWKVNPVGPLCKSGGLRELARMTCDSSQCFSSIAWVPTILPSSTLGDTCNSPSSCFVASNEGSLVVYQAVVDAGGLLNKIYASEMRAAPHSVDDDEDSSSVSSTNTFDESSIKENIKDMFNVVSSQSTSKPGCILKLTKIPNSEHNDSVFFIHVFNENLVTSRHQMESNKTNSPETDFSPKIFERFFIVIIERIMNGIERLRMWSVEFFSQAPIVAVNSDQSDGEVSHIQPSVILKVKTEKVCEQIFDLPDDVKILSAVPAAGHLSSSSMYPACKAPYLILTACSDEHVRFWKCSAFNDAGKLSYVWSMWGMVSGVANSDLEMDGEIFSVSSAHSGRFACAYTLEGTASNSLPKTVKIGVFECESSGGVEWLLEDTLSVDYQKSCSIKSSEFSSNDYFMKQKNELGCNDETLRTNFPAYGHKLLRRISSKSAIAQPTAVMKRVLSANALRASEVYENKTRNGLIRLDWVSAEDGSHILTVAVGSTIYFYAQISQDAAQRNIVMMKEHEVHRRPQLRKMSSLGGHQRITSRLTHWLCIRFLELHSADGLPPCPTALKWVRDGLLIVGMQSEMRCYNQWNFSAKYLRNEPIKPQNVKDDNAKKIVETLGLPSLTISPSHSMLSQLSKKPKVDISAASKQKAIIEVIQKVLSVPYDIHDYLSKDEHILAAVSDEGLFEAARLANPILPQYHPKQLIELLNSGRTREIKAILLHVLNCLKQSNVSIPNPLSRASSARRLSLSDMLDNPTNVDASKNMMETIDDANPEYDELDGIAPIPLHLLMSLRDDNSNEMEKAANINDQYSTLFEVEQSEEELDLDVDDEMHHAHKESSLSCDTVTNFETISAVFTARHNRLLTELLTHTHLPGLSSVDQMHLLAIADTISHFSSNAMDKLAQANAALYDQESRFLIDAGSGYAAAAAGIETIDECGLRYLMALKQHEYLLLCLPLKQKTLLKKKGLSSSNIIWALHSETETELLNAISPLHKSNLIWEELRAVGIAWWLKSTASLKAIIEKLAKSAFQLNQNPMDASLYYMAMRKKNVLTHLFKTVKDSKMADFFMQDFSEEKWIKAALKNAFVLLSKQRFHHAAAFFLLAGSLRDSIQTILNKLQDLQLAMVVIRLYETDMEKQSSLMRELLNREILGLKTDLITQKQADYSNEDEFNSLSSRDPFERSMTYWHLKMYSKSAETLLEEGSKNSIEQTANCSLSDIFNFYSFLRNHPFVLREKLAKAGIQIGVTDKFQAFAKQLTYYITPGERRLYFRTASAHLVSGCPFLALAVLMRLPKTISLVIDNSESLFNFLNSSGTLNCEKDTVNNFDWSAPTNVVREDVFEYKWDDDNDDDNDEDQEEMELTRKKTEEEQKISSLKDRSIHSDNEHTSNEFEENFDKLDTIAQHMKFVASLRILVEELATLASGFEVDGGQLRYQIFRWLEKEIEVLKEVCDYKNCDSKVEDEIEDEEECLDTSLPLHEALRKDRVNLTYRAKVAMRRRIWLRTNQRLIRAFTSYCALHNAQNHRLTSALMELLLLLLDIQQDSVSKSLQDPLPVYQSFPLLVASLSSSKMFVSSPLRFLRNQSADLLRTIIEMEQPPRIDASLAKVFMLYNLCQGLSACLYQSLCDVDKLSQSEASSIQFKYSGVLTRRPLSVSTKVDVQVSTIPSKWPGVNNFIALLCREKGEEANHLRLLLVEIFVAVSMSLFAYAFTAYDSRWLFRLSAHSINAKRFAMMFGGGGEKKLRAKTPGRPYVFGRKATISSSHESKEDDSTENVSSEDLNIDSTSFRAKFNAKIFGNAVKTSKVDFNMSVQDSHSIEQVILQWIAPKKNIVQMFAERPEIRCKEEFGFDYDSEEENDSDELNDEKDGMNDENKEYNDPDGFAWSLMRIALVQQQLYRLQQFVILSGFELDDLPALSSRVDAIFKLLESWIRQLAEKLSAFPYGCPNELLKNMNIDNSANHLGPSLRKYRSLLEPGNTPFETDNPAVLPVKRLWTYLVRQDHLMKTFIRYIFESKGRQEGGQLKVDGAVRISDQQITPLSDVYKIIQRENEPITAFACNQVKQGWIVVATSRELQEMDISQILEENIIGDGSSWINNRTELDIILNDSRSDPVKDNDDYQLLIDDSRRGFSTNFLLKRQVNGIRRMDSHPSLPYYISGSSDGSIRLWEWGVGQPLFTPRIAGQYAKVTKVTFSTNGNKFAAVDNDGILCIWQATHGLPIRKPFFNQKCHSKSASDVKFLDCSSSMLITAGNGSNDQNITLWDTLMPHSKAVVHAWTGHSDGATCLAYLASNLTIISGGRHGEICCWDVRQRMLRTTVKCFDGSGVKCLATDPSHEYVIAGSSDGDIKVWNFDSHPQLAFTLTGEHATRGGFSLRQVGSGSIQGVQQIYIDPQLRLFSCGADNSLKLRYFSGLLKAIH